MLVTADSTRRRRDIGKGRWSGTSIAPRLPEARCVDDRKEGILVARPTSVADGSLTGSGQLRLRASVPPPIESDLCTGQDALDRVGRDLATTALTSCDPIGEATGALTAAAGRLHIPRPDLARALLDRTLADPRFTEIPPRLALRAQLDLFAAAAGVSEATLWVATRPGCVTCLASSSGIATVRRLKVLARTTIEDDAVTITGTRSPILGVPVRRNGVSCGTLAVRLPNLADRGTVEPLAQVAARRLSAVLERQLFLEHGESRARAATATTERRLVRTGYDLHDGPLQALAVLADELRLVSADVGRLVPPGCREAVAQALTSVHEQAASVEYQIREIAQSLETSAVALRPLKELLEREATIVSRRSGIHIVADIRANLAELTDSQRIVLYRGVQEALSNVARHSAAGTATIRVRSERGGVAVTICDDGCGFDSARMLPAAAKRGRLGLVGVAERARLLGGFLTVRSVPGAGTSIKIVLPAWSPLGAASGDRAHSS
jgi:signal transduction histidine kinase